MQLQVGDRFTDETGEWEIVSRPATTVGGKTVRARVQKVSEPAVKEERVWSGYEKVAVKRGMTLLAALDVFYQSTIAAATWTAASMATASG